MSKIGIKKLVYFKKLNSIEPVYAINADKKKDKKD